MNINIGRNQDFCDSENVVSHVSIREKTIRVGDTQNAKWYKTISIILEHVWVVTTLV